MIFATFAAGTVLSAVLFGIALATGDRAGMAWFGLGLLFFGYPTCRVAAFLLDVRYRLFGGRFAGVASDPPAQPRPRRTRHFSPRSILAALSDYVLTVTLAGLVVLLLMLMLGA